MISSIEIKNFRGIQDGKLENLTPLTILVGPNGSGKSTILDGLMIGANSDPSEALSQILGRRKEGNSSSKWIFRNGLSKDISELTTFSSDWQKVYLVPPSRIKSFLKPDSDHIIKTRIVDFDPSGRFSLRTSSLTYLDSNIFRIDPMRIEDSTPLHTLLTEAIHQGQREAVREILQSLVPGLKEITILTEGNSPYVALEYSDRAIPASLSGSGIHQLLRESLELASRADGIALMEEPEVNKHPAAITQTAKVIFAAVRRGVQVIITTHSLELIDALIREAKDEAGLSLLSVFGLKLDGGCLKSYHLIGDEVKMSRTQMEMDLR